MILAWADRALHVAAAALLVVLLATVMAGVISRGVGHPLSWTDEGAGFLMVWLACLGWMIATRRGAHIRIRFFQLFISLKIRHIITCSMRKRRP